MSIIFQLFSAEDLKDFSQSALDSLKATIQNDVHQSGDPSLIASIGISRDLEEELYQQPPPANIPIARLRKRAHEVFQQLTQRQPDDQNVPSQGSIFEQLLAPADFSYLDKTLPNTGRIILVWAIVCELAHFQSYRTLRNIRDGIINEAQINIQGFVQGRRFKDPDSVYSLFIPDSPVYGLNLL